MKKIIAIVCYTVLSCLTLMDSAYSTEIVKVKQTGITNIVSKKKDIKAVIMTHRVQGETYSYTVTKLIININGADIGVPKSVYGDLYEPNEAKIVIIKNQTYLEITGGDGAESYFVRIYFNNKEIKRRVLFSSIIPDKPLEETRYWTREL